MLRSLRISNYALIESAEWNPSSGLNVITGETGAGKSILLGALGLIRGERADKNVLYNPEQKCVVEGVFELDRDRFEAFFEQHDLDFYSETWLRREFSEQGRSRAFINDSPVVLEVMRSLTQLLIDVHGQRYASARNLSGRLPGIQPTINPNKTTAKRYPSQLTRKRLSHFPMERAQRYELNRRRAG